MKRLDGSVRISRVQGRQEGDRIEIVVQDSNARCEAITIILTAEEFGDALSNIGSKCKFEFNDSGVVGTIGQNKEEIVEVEDTRPSIIGENAALKLWEVDGWKARHGDISNHHNWISHNMTGWHKQKVVFFRNVKDETNE